MRNRGRGCAPPPVQIPQTTKMRNFTQKGWTNCVTLLWRFNKLKTKRAAEILKPLGSVNNEKGIGNRAGAGVLNINGGTITSTGANYNVTSNPGGATTTGAALAVAEHTTNQGVTVNINGGTITNVAGGKAISVANPEETEEAKGANVSVNGGTISGDVKVGENVKSTVEGKEPLTVSGDYNMTKDSEGNYTIAKKPTSYYYYSPSTTTPDTTTKGSPKTFDAGVGIYAVTAVLSMTGMAWTAKKRH